MTYCIITRWDTDGRVNKMLDGYADEAATADDLARVRETFASAFVVLTPAAPVSEWIADPVAKTVTVSPLPISRDVINKERDRRIDGGFIWNTYEFQSDLSSRENITGAQGLSLGAMMLDPQGTAGLRWANAERDFTWTSTDNVEVPMTAAQCQAFCQAAMVYKTSLIKTAQYLKNLEVIPQNYTDNAYWPSKTLK